MKIYIESNAKIVPLEKEWINLIQYARLHPYSELIIEFKEGKPTMIRMGIETTKL